MPLLVLPCTAADMPRMAIVEKAAFSGSPLEPVLFPGPFPEGIMDIRGQELAEQMADDPTTRWFKVVDSDSPNPEEGIAFAKWNHWVDTLPDLSGRKKLGPGCNIEACEMLFGGLAQMKERLLANKHCIYLHMLITHPDHQRRGAGGLLLNWGVEESKLHKVPLHLESSLQGHELYKRYGFRDIEIFQVDFSKWGWSEPHRNWAMICEPDTVRA